MNKFSIAIVVAATAFATATVSQAHAEECGSYKTAKAADNSIAAIAAKSSSFSILAAALEAAGLDEALAGNGPFTVFAPTDEAFARLPKGTVKSLLLPRNRDKLRALLLYHVVGAKLDAKHVAAKAGFETLNGQRIEFKTKRGKVKIDKATVVVANVVADNGIIHGIDRVLMPSSLDLVETARSAKRFKSLLAALDAAELQEALGQDGPYTVLAPTDRAFARLGSKTIDALFEPDNRDQLIAILKDHVISGRLYASDAVAKKRVHSAANNTLNFGVREGRIVVEGAKVVSTDIDATNGVIHVIDRVIVR